MKARSLFACVYGAVQEENAAHLVKRENELKESQEITKRPSIAAKQLDGNASWIRSTHFCSSSSAAFALTLMNLRRPVSVPGVDKRRKKGKYLSCCSLLCRLTLLFFTTVLQYTYGYISHTHRGTAGSLKWSNSAWSAKNVYYLWS